MTGRPAGIGPAPDLLAMRMAKIVIIAIVAAFFSIVAFTNIMDFETNQQFVHHVLSMDTTFGSPDLMWRAIDDPALQRAAYWLIIVWEGVTAILCWLGVAALSMVWSAPSAAFDRARTFAIVGLLMGLVLYAFGFLVVASEWFAMWQSDKWSAQATAGMFTTVLIGALVLIGLRESPGVHGADGEST
jgi:predicted small integral membrane protein